MFQYNSSYKSNYIFYHECILVTESVGLTDRLVFCVEDMVNVTVVLVVDVGGVVVCIVIEVVVVIIVVVSTVKLIEAA